MNRNFLRIYYYDSASATTLLKAKTEFIYFSTKFEVQMSNEIKVAVIGAIAVIIAAIIGYFATKGSESGISQKDDSGSVNNAGRDINSVGRDNTNAGRDINVTNFYKDTLQEKNKSVKSSETINQSVTSHNQKGGITAFNVIVPDDKEIDLKNNFEYLISKKGDGFVISFWPKQGKWNGVFFAVPQNEYEVNLSQLSIGNSGIIKDGFEGTIELFFDLKNRRVRCNQIGSMSEEVSKKRPGNFSCESIPSDFVFGEYSNTEKVYYGSRN